MDYTFLMEDDSYIHFEFQTINKCVENLLSGKDLEKVKEELRVTELGKSLIEEVKEESGLDVITKRIIAIQDKNKHNNIILSIIIYAYLRFF